MRIINLIESHERSNTLDEFTLVSLAMMMVYERFFDIIFFKRTIIQALEDARLRFFLLSAFDLLAGHN